MLAPGAYHRPVSIRLWRPLSARLAGKPVSAVVTYDASDALEKKLREWVDESLEYDEDQYRIALRLDIPEAFEDKDYLHDESYIDADDLWAVIDVMLDLNCGDRDSLQQLLDDGLSAYTISRDGRSLQYRTDVTARSAVDDAITTAGARNDTGSAADHLAAAWAKAYAIRPEFSESYSESIKAVEAAAHALVEPNNTRATLGTMLGHLRSQPGQFCLALPAPGISVTPVIGMMTTLWEGQTSRHGSQTPTRPETKEEARAAVHLAVVLVQWFTSGMIQRRAAN